MEVYSPRCPICLTPEGAKYQVDRVFEGSEMVECHEACSVCGYESHFAHGDIREVIEGQEYHYHWSEPEETHDRATQARRAASKRWMKKGAGKND